MGNNLLQIILLVNVFIIGILIPVGIHHIREHFRPAEHKPTHKAAGFELPPKMRETLMKEAQAHFQIVANKGAANLAHKLDAASDAMTAELHKIAESAALRQTQEFERARTGIEQTGDAAVAAVRSAETTADETLGDRRDELMKTLEAEVTAATDDRKQAAIAQIDAKLDDAVVAYLLEALGHEVDLGSQMNYIIARLDENKAALKAEVSA